METLWAPTNGALGGAPIGVRAAGLLLHGQLLGHSVAAGLAGIRLEADQMGEVE
ncbi:MAG: hypothetical protein VX542_02935 [Cyanobacteriota bacterium]|nr:hypothetical protein [Cyanobacteriota bacterium]